MRVTYFGQACTLNGECASGFCDPSNSTCACDTDPDCAAGQVCNLTPSPNICVAAGCGNGVVEVGEGCDDGNTTSDIGSITRLGDVWTIELRAERSGSGTGRVYTITFSVTDAAANQTMVDVSIVVPMRIPAP